jgi:cation:H+ antiporter
MEEVHIILFLISIIPLSLLLLEEASHLIGLVLIVAFPAFCWFCLKKRVAPRERPLSLRVGRLLLHLTLLMLGVLGVIGSAEYVVRSAVGVAELAGVATAVIGATVIAVGTSLPELSVDITAIKRGSTDLAIGDVLGSSLVNLTLVLGVTLTASPFVINMSVYQTLIVFLLLSNLLLWLFFERGKVGLPGGLTFLIIYFVFLTAVVMAR